MKEIRFGEDEEEEDTTEDWNIMKLLEGGGYKVWIPALQDAVFVSEARSA